MKVLIIEDENLAAQKLIGLLQQIDQSIKILGVLETVEESVNWLNSNSQPDLIFMDIQLNDGVCFEIFQSIKIECSIIFTTAFDEFALQAFKVNSIDYLLKPIKIDDVRNALDKFQSIYKKKNYSIELENLLSRFNKKYKERFLVKVGDRYKSILCSEVNCFYIRERSTFIFTSGKRNVGIDYSLEQIENIINPEHFFRVNRNFIININSIKEIVSYSTSRLKLNMINWEDHEDVLVSRDRVSKFKQWMDR